MYVNLLWINGKIVVVVIPSAAHRMDGWKQHCAYLFICLYACAHACVLAKAFSDQLAIELLSFVMHVL